MDFGPENSVKYEGNTKYCTIRGTFMGYPLSYNKSIILYADFTFLFVFTNLYVLSGITTETVAMISRD